MLRTDRISGDGPSFWKWTICRSPSGDMPTHEGALGVVRRNGGFLDRAPDPAALPPWFSGSDVDFYVGEFARTGFRGGLNWYRNIDRHWELLAPFAGAQVTVPALYIAGDRNLVVSFKGMDQLIANLATFVPICEEPSCCRPVATGPSRSARKGSAQRWSISSKGSRCESVAYRAKAQALVSGQRCAGFPRFA
jgi:hypothetical protein